MACVPRPFKPASAASDSALLCKGGKIRHISWKRKYVYNILEIEHRRVKISWKEQAMLISSFRSLVLRQPMAAKSLAWHFVLKIVEMHSCLITRPVLWRYSELYLTVNFEDNRGFFVLFWFGVFLLTWTDSHNPLHSRVNVYVVEWWVRCQMSDSCLTDGTISSSWGQQQCLDNYICLIFLKNIIIVVIWSCIHDTQHPIYKNLVLIDIKGQHTRFLFMIYSEYTEYILGFLCQLNMYSK